MKYILIGLLCFFCWQEDERWLTLVEHRDDGYDVVMKVILGQDGATFTYAGRDGKFDTEDDVDCQDVFKLPSDSTIHLVLTSSDLVYEFGVLDTENIVRDVIQKRYVHLSLESSSKLGELEVVWSPYAKGIEEPDDSTVLQIIEKETFADAIQQLKDSTDETESANE